MKWKTIIASSLLAISLLTACATGEAQGTGAENQALADTVTVEHDLGTAEVAVIPEKTIVFDYGILDMLDSIGIEIAGLPKASLPSSLAEYAADEYTATGTLHEPDFEVLAGIAPDLILFSGRAQDHYGELSRLAPSVFLAISTDDYLGSMEENARTLGRIYDREEEFTRAMEEIKDRAEGIRKKMEGKGENALILLANDGGLSAYGPASRFGLIHSLGFEPVDTGIEDSTHGQNVTFEYVLKMDPDHIFVIDRAMVAGGENSAEALFDNELIRQTAAYKEERIHYLDAWNWYVISGGFTSTRGMLTELEGAAE